MIYSEIIKKDPKGFIIKSTKQRIFVNAKLVKLIKYKEFNNSVLVFYKLNKKIYQRYYSKDYFDKRCNSNKELMLYILNYKDILLFRKVKKVANRYIRRYNLNFFNKN